jgi:hypothetical protein
LEWRAWQGTLCGVWSELVSWALLYFFMFFVALAAEARAWLVGCTGYQNIIASMLTGGGAMRAHAKGA